MEQTITETKLKELSPASIFNMEKLDSDSQYLFYSIVSSFISVITVTKSEILGLFTYGEICLVLDSLIKIDYNNRLTIKDQVLNSVLSGIHFRELENKWKVDCVTLIGKLDNLTEAQCFILFVLKNEFISSPGKSEEKIKRIFEINEILKY